MITDSVFVLFLNMQTAMPGWVFNDNYYWVAMSTTAILEVFRRAMWWYFRLECDQLENSGGYRKVLMVPISPRHTIMPGRLGPDDLVNDNSVDQEQDSIEQQGDDDYDSDAAQWLIELMTV
jgi:hypothetical protein